ncbi:MAG TPA: pirin family protein [Nevskiaceae bacterium]|nr:pirin family protein [Nevskiaceae bacterium]
MFERLGTRGVDVGGLAVHRALPSRARRMVGAWCFLDHAGPAPASLAMRIGPHPHMGLQTFTWMIEGEVMHDDSLGNHQLVRPGEVNLMTAGRGIAHAEVSQPRPDGRLHAAQLWIALPEAQRHCAPGFAHYTALPGFERGGVRVTLLVGEMETLKAAPTVWSPLVGADCSAATRADAELVLEPRFEYAVLGLSGDVRVEGQALAPDELIYLGARRRTLRVASASGGHWLLVGGEPFAEPILLFWNFVARNGDEMVQAGADWNAQRRFGEVAGVDLPRLVAPDATGLRFKA